jgi:DNA repair exonuclease SbcCD ATPase subunit
MNLFDSARHRLVVLTLCCAALSPAQAFAQQAPKKADPAVARQAELIRKLQSSENQLKEANAKLSQEKSAADEALAAANKGRAAEAARNKADQTQAQALRRQLSDKQDALAKVERELEQSRRELEQSRRDLREDRTRVAELDKDRQGQSARAVRAEANAEQQTLLLTRSAASAKDLDLQLRECRGQNKALSGITHDLLSAIDKAGYGDALIGKEPFSGYKRVRVEALIQEYRDKVDDRRSDLTTR